MFWSISPVYFITFSLSHVFRFLHHWRCYQSSRSVLSQTLSHLQSDLQCCRKARTQTGRVWRNTRPFENQYNFQALTMSTSSSHQEYIAAKQSWRTAVETGWISRLQTSHAEWRGLAAWPLQGSACTVCPRPSLHLKIHTADTLFPWDNTIYTRLLVHI